MKPFDVWANIIAGLLVWLLLTGLVYFFVSWGSDESPGSVPFWPWKAAILVIAVLTFIPYARKYLRKLDR